MVLYKTVLKKWHKGTCGRSGLTKEFEGWSDAKLEKYSVDLNSYDHRDISTRSTVLIHGYRKNRTPFLTLIYLWDK